MIRKLIAIAIFSTSMVFAQTDDAEYTRSSAPTVPPPPTEYAWNVSIHPISLIIMTALRIPTVYLTVERTIGERTSVIGRPYFLYASSSAYDLDSDDASFSIFCGGIQGGLRYYLNPMHRGLYFDVLLQYAHVGLDYDDNDGGSASASANGFGPYVYSGWKSVMGNTVFFFDVGIGYNIVSAEAKGRASAEEDLERVSGADSGIGYDLDIAFGLAF